MATTAATRRKATARSDGEGRTEAVARLLADRVRQGLSRRVSDPVVVATLAAALTPNGNGHSAVSYLSKRQRRRMAGVAKEVGVDRNG